MPGKRTRKRGSGAGKSWREKLASTEKKAEENGLPKVVKIEGKLRRLWGDGTCAVPSPAEVEELMAGVPEGRLTTINRIREEIALRHKATIGCPITTGIFAGL